MRLTPHIPLEHRVEVHYSRSYVYHIDIDSACCKDRRFNVPYSGYVKEESSRCDPVAVFNDSPCSKFWRLVIMREYQSATTWCLS